jgi:hypothetical protein
MSQGFELVSTHDTTKKYVSTVAIANVAALANCTSLGPGFTPL